jgi:hypothetical protein
MTTYRVTNSDQVIDIVKADTLEDCKNQLRLTGYSDSEVACFEYSIQEINSRYSLAEIRRDLIIVVNPLEFWALRKGSLFVTQKHFESNGLETHILMKINNEETNNTANFDLGLIGVVDPYEIVFLVVKD